MKSLEKINDKIAFLEECEARMKNKVPKKEYEQYCQIDKNDVQEFFLLLITFLVLVLIFVLSTLYMSLITARKIGALGAVLFFIGLILNAYCKKE